MMAIRKATFQSSWNAHALKLLISATGQKSFMMLPPMPSFVCRAHIFALVNVSFIFNLH